MKKTMMTTFLLSAALAFGQGPGGTPPDPAKMIEMRVNMLANQLSLTEEQKSQATKIFTDAQTSSQTARTAMETARESLLAAIKTNNVATIDQLSRDIGAATTDLTAIEGKSQAAFYAILTPEQQTKYDSFAHRGPGGPGGPGMGPGPAGMWRRR
ncbi:MAG: Spy/CpxP family protein refolding chaperone [Acidobacteria bacterium]|nr:Spy/CpxP family protein refolding chaperone [Acidobacteriota bacterium]